MTKKLKAEEQKKMSTVTAENLTTSTGTPFVANTSEQGLSWRLVHDGDRVLALFESSGRTSTIHQLFVGTLAECESEISTKQLIPLEEEEI